MEEIKRRKNNKSGKRQMKWRKRVRKKGRREKIEKIRIKK
jgi:hypothetical protein